MNPLILLFIFLLNTGNGPDTDENRERILDMAREVLSEQFDEEVYRFELQARWIPNSLLNSDEDNILGVRQISPLSSYTGFEVRYRHRGTLTTAEIQLKVSMKQFVPVTAHRIEQGTLVSMNDLIMRWVEVSPGREHPVTKPEEITGSVLRRTLLSFEPILEDHLSEPLMITAGQEVTLNYESNGIMISVLCEARQDGSIQEEIPVFCKETRRKYLTLVTGQGEVTWLKTQ